MRMSKKGFRVNLTLASPPHHESDCIPISLKITIKPTAPFQTSKSSLRPPNSHNFTLNIQILATQWFEM